MMKEQTQIWWNKAVFIGSFFFLNGSGIAEPSKTFAGKPWDARYANAPDAGQWKWTQAPWDGDDRPFIALRAQIDRAIAKGQKPEVLLRRYKVQSLKKRRDAKAQFAYGYSAYRASVAADYDYDKSSMLLAYVPFVLEQPTFPRSYQYARLMFLVMTKSPSDQRLRWAGDRLVKRNPKDYAVKMGLATTLIYTTLLKKPEKEQAIRLINDSLRANPRDANMYATKGSVYYLTSNKSHSLAEVQKAIDGYQKYLDLAPNNEDFRPLAQRIIAELKARKKEFAS